MVCCTKVLCPQNLFSRKSQRYKGCMSRYVDIRILCFWHRHVLLAIFRRGPPPPLTGLRVTEYFAQSLNITRGDSKWHSWVGRVWVPISISLKLCLCVVPFLRYSASNNGEILKLWVRVVQSRWKWFDRSYDILLVLYYKYSSILYHFSSYLVSSNIVTLKSRLGVVQGHWEWRH